MSEWRKMRAAALAESHRERAEARGDMVTVSFDPDRARMRAAESLDLMGDISNPTFGKYASGGER